MTSLSNGKRKTRRSLLKDLKEQCRVSLELELQRRSQRRVVIPPAIVD